jgi:hypothetical protein
LGVNFLESLAQGEKAARTIQDVNVSQRVKKILVFVLAIDINELLAKLFKHVQGDGAAIQIGPGVPGALDEAPDEQSIRFLQVEAVQDLQSLSSLELEESFHRRLFLPGSNHFRGSSTPQEEVDGIDQDGFSGAGFPGQDVEARPEFNVQLIDDRKIFDIQLGQHNPTTPAFAQRSPHLNLVRKIWK